MADGRPGIPADVERQVLIESGHRCAVCGESPVERAHIIPWNESKEHKAENLIALCPLCHARADKQNWGKKTLRIYKENPWVLRRKETDTESFKKLMVRRHVTFRLPVSFSSFGDRDLHIVRHALAGFLGLPADEVEIVEVEEGSVIVTVLLPEDAAEKLVKNVHNDDFIWGLTNEIKHRKRIRHRQTVSVSARLNLQSWLQSSLVAIGVITVFLTVGSYVASLIWLAETSPVAWLDIHYDLPLVDDSSNTTALAVRRYVLMNPGPGRLENPNLEIVVDRPLDVDTNRLIGDDFNLIEGPNVDVHKNYMTSNKTELIVQPASRVLEPGQRIDITFYVNERDWEPERVDVSGGGLVLAQRPDLRIMSSHGIEFWISVALFALWTMTLSASFLLNRSQTKLRTRLETELDNLEDEYNLVMRERAETGTGYVTPTSRMIEDARLEDRDN